MRVVALSVTQGSHTLLCGYEPFPPFGRIKRIDESAKIMIARGKFLTP